MKASGSRLIFFIIFFLLTFSIFAQSNEKLFSRQFIWQRDENVSRYAVEIDKSENGTYRSHLREFTTSSSIEVSLPPGSYRFRIIPHDLNAGPGDATRWIRFEIRASASQVSDAPALKVTDVSAETKHTQENDAGEYQPSDNAQIAESEEQTTESEKPSNRFNTIGVSIGTSFIDPLITATIHGSYSPYRNLYLQFGFDAGFLSVYEDVDFFYCLYPYINVGAFVPIGKKFGFYAGAGIGFMYSSHTFTNNRVNQYILTLNATTGFLLWNAINISYTLKTEFETASHLLSVGYVYRFKEREKTSRRGAENTENTENIY